VPCLGQSTSDAFGEAGPYSLALKYTTRVAAVLTELEAVEADISYCVE
jgi:hypothetical protein